MQVSALKHFKFIEDRKQNIYLCSSVVFLSSVVYVFLVCEDASTLCSYVILFGKLYIFIYVKCYEVPVVVSCLCHVDG